MKRVAIVGHPDNIKRVDLVIKDSFSNIESFPIEMIDMSQVQTTTHFLKEHIDDFDGVIFTGKILYDIMNHNMHSQNPWVYLKNDDSQLQRALIKAMLKYDHDITQISIDSYPEETVRQIYADLELDQNLYHTNVSQINIFNESLMDDLYNFHANHCRSHENALAITGVSNVYKTLEDSRIPCMLLTPNENAIKDTLHDLLDKIKYEDLTVSQIVVISMEIDTSDEYDIISENEYSLMLQKTRITEEVYKFAQRIQAAVVETEKNYLLFTTKQIVESETHHLRELPILRAIKKKTKNTVSVGIGFGITAREAKSSALIGKNKALKMGGDQCFVVYDRKHMERIKPLDRVNNDKLPQLDTTFKEISEKSGVSVNNIYQLKCIMDIYKKDQFTSHELSEEFGNSLRSMNRIIEKLENAGYIDITGKKIVGKAGRPSRILKLKI